MITKPIKISFTPGSVAVLKVIIEQLITLPAQAYALNMLLLAGKFDCDAAVMLSREIIRLIDPKI
jgi:hypothetical protein